MGVFLDILVQAAFDSITPDHICQAELESIYHACNYLEENHNQLKPKCVKILTD